MTDREFLEILEAHGGRVIGKKGNKIPDHYEIEPDPVSKVRYYIDPHNLTVRNVGLLWDH